MSEFAQIAPRDFRLACREGRYVGTTRGVAFGFLQCNLVILHEVYAYEFLLYCQRNQRACPVLEVCDTGVFEARRLAPHSDLRTDLPRYAVYRDGLRQPDETDIRHLCRPEHTAFLIGSGISFDHALEQAGVQTTRDRWVVRTTLPTTPAGRFEAALIVTMRWLAPDQAIKAVQVTTRFPFNHGAPIHIGDPALIGADLRNPLVGPPVTSIPTDVVPVFWACGVTPQQAAIEAKLDLMITHAPAHGFVTDVPARELAVP
ncbi:MAG TPA: DUF1445 domain-containing protein [Bryobacteraceae bacterium]|nr:DUF1445 domain-containing protein [Bryobacteraceae bacterium]